MQFENERKSHMGDKTRYLSEKRPLKLSLLLVPVLVFLVMLFSVFGFKIDDTYITLRYAQNLSNGYGSVFNVGERVEGYTNFSLVLVEAFFAWVGLADLLYTKIFLVICGVLTILATEYFGWLRHRTIFAAMVGGLLVATSSPFVLWTAGGLETTLFAFLITIGLLLEIARLEGQLSGRRAIIVGSIFFLVFITRPDGLLFYTSVVLFDFLYSMHNKEFSGFFLNLVSFLVPTGCYLMWKVWFYGRMLPAAFYAKVPSLNSTSSFLKTFAKGIVKSLTFLVMDLNVLMVLAILVGVLVLYRRRHSVNAKLFEPVFILATGVLYVGYLASLGFSVSMDDAYRFYVPLIPIMALALLSIWGHIGVRPSKKQACICLPGFFPLSIAGVNSNVNSDNSLLKKHTLWCIL